MAATVDLDLFWQLSSADDKVRSNAAVVLTEALQKVQAEHNVTHVNAKSADSDSDELNPDGDLCDDLVYTIKRLVRGLASSREGARHGFSLALTLALRTFPVMRAKPVFALILELLQVKAESKQEEKECGFGRLFGCMALFQSGRLQFSKEESARAESESSCEQVLCWKVMEELLRLMKSKSFMAEAATHSLILIMKAVPKELFRKHFAPFLRSQWKGTAMSDMGPEMLDLMLNTDMRCVDTCPSYVQPRNIKQLVEPLKFSTSAHPRIHHVWESLIFVLTREESKGDCLFPDFSADARRKPL
eukprot:3270859-Rhodomonas_salina.1